jgi:phosphoribosylanthranilate isomerase
MITQIYEITSAQEARELCALGVDHIGVLVGEGSFPRELSIEAARPIVAAITPPARASVLSLSADIRFIARIVETLRAPILHIGSAPEEIAIADMKAVKRRFPNLRIMRSVPVVDRESVALAKSYDGVADLLLTDSYSSGDKQIGALGVTHSWDLDRDIIESVSIPVIIAGGLGPENVRAAIRATRPAGVDSKTRTDKADGSHTKDIAKVRAFVEAARTA